MQVQWVIGIRPLILHPAVSEIAWVKNWKCKGWTMWLRYSCEDTELEDALSKAFFERMFRDVFHWCLFFSTVNRKIHSMHSDSVTKWTKSTIWKYRREKRRSRRKWRGRKEEEDKGKKRKRDWRWYRRLSWSQSTLEPESLLWISKVEDELLFWGGQSRQINCNDNIK